MISFKQFFILQENKKPLVGGIGDVPRGAMKVSTRVTDLPDNPPYGFWVDRSGNFKAVGFQQHNVEAAKMLAKANIWLMKHDLPEIKVYDYANDPYDRLFENGWVRVVLRPQSGEIYYNGERGHQATQSQMKFLNFIKDLYDMRSVELKF